VADQLFATLDPTIRKVELPNGREVLISDTVGFIQKLPTTLIAAFRATLEEILEADLILHVVDTSHPSVLAQIETVEDTLAQIEAEQVPRILVWNKIDKWHDETYPVVEDGLDYVEEVGISALKGEGFEELKQAIADALAAQLKPMRLLLPYDRGDIVSYLFQTGRVIRQEHIEAGIILEVEMPAKIFERYKDYEYVELKL
jgi:GTP-binding protein HflX